MGIEPRVKTSLLDVNASSGFSLGLKHKAIAM
jgi:hypothetical protein